MHKHAQVFIGPVLTEFETFGKLMEYGNTKYHVRCIQQFWADEMETGR